jgi:hypothetical protein
MGEPAITPAARLEQLTSQYERQAYVVWNVALRIGLTPERARDAARRAFLAQVTAGDEARTALDAARLAVEGAQPVDPRSIDDPVLAASAGLAPVQRAALALPALADAVAGQVATAFGITESAAHEVRAGALSQLGTLLAVPAVEAQQAYDELAWDEPPAELWQELYPDMHAAVTQHARALAAEPATPTPARRRVRVPSVPRAALVPVALLAIAGVAWAASGGGSGQGTAQEGGAGTSGIISSSGSGSSSGGSENTAPPLSAKELDRLRQKEIEDLKRFTARKADKSLPPRERKRAARKVDDLVKLAQARQEAAERRELAVRSALARERQARMRERARRREAREDRDSAEHTPRPQEPQPAPQPKPRREPQKPSDDGRDDKPADDGDQAECLYDAGSGQYICPE